MAEFNKEQEELMFQAPIPGESLTADPENPSDFEKPPKYVEVEKFIDDLFMNITDEEQIDGILDPIRKGVPIEDVAQMLLFQAFATGQISPDLQLLAVEPVLFMLIGLSQYAGIDDAVLYPEESFGLDDQEVKGLLKEDGDNIDPGEAAPKIEGIKEPKGMSKSLIDKLKQGDI